MKEYKYKINGNVYKVAIGDIDDNLAQVEVNGVPYKVEIDQTKSAKVAAVQAPRPSAAPLNPLQAQAREQLSKRPCPEQ